MLPRVPDTGLLSSTFRGSLDRDFAPVLSADPDTRILRRCSQRILLQGFHTSAFKGPGHKDLVQVLLNLHIYFHLGELFPSPLTLFGVSFRYNFKIIGPMLHPCRV